MESDQTFIQKTFQLINQLTGKITLIPMKVLYLPSTRQINISRALSDIHTTGIQLNNCHIFYLDCFKSLFVHLGKYPLNKQILLKYELFLQITIKIRYREISGIDNSKSSKGTIASLMLPQKKSRVVKTIKEVLQIVSKWRGLYQVTDMYGKRIYTLDSAAQKLGMQRKTLDDYYFKIKSAQSYGFDLQKNKNQKIGILRQYVKQCVKNKKPKINYSDYSYTNYPQQQTLEEDIGKYLADEAGCSSSDNESV